MSAYLDNSATTKPCDECVSAVMNMLTDNFGNPSSLHNLGINAMKEIILQGAQLPICLVLIRMKLYSHQVRLRLTIWLCSVQLRRKSVSVTE